MIKNIKWAIDGFLFVWREEFMFRIETGLGAVSLFLGWYVRLSLLEWALLTACIIMVLGAEMVNTAIEDLCNKVEPRSDPLIGKIKDIMAGFVLLVSLGALIVGILLFSAHMRW